MTTKHLIIIGKEGTGREARKILDLIPNGFRLQLKPDYNIYDIGKISVLPYMKMFFVEDVPNQIEVAKMTKNIQLFNSKAPIVFTCSKACPALKTDNRYNIIHIE